MISDTLPIAERVAKAVSLAALIPKVATELRRLYAKGALPEEVDRKTIHTFLEEAAAVEEQAAELRERLKEHSEWLKSLKKLGFGES